MVLDSKFLYLDDVDTSIITSLRYSCMDNLTGKPLNGYINSKTILTKEAALALKKANEIFHEKGYTIVIYDAYRPLKAVEDFVKWSQNSMEQIQKQYYYPYLKKEKLFDLGFISMRSSHTRGSTVDMSIIKIKQKLHDCIAQERIFNGMKFWYLNDGTEDMGTSFDLMDDISCSNSPVVQAQHKENRQYIRTVMENCGFVALENEWWHFTLKNEPYPYTYWDFDVE